MVKAGIMRVHNNPLKSEVTWFLYLEDKILGSEAKDL